MGARVSDKVEVRFRFRVRVRVRTKRRVKLEDVDTSEGRITGDFNLLSSNS